MTTATTTAQQAQRKNDAIEKEKVMAEALQHEFTVDEIRERLRNNRTALLVEFLRKLKLRNDGLTQ